VDLPGLSYMERMALSPMPAHGHGRRRTSRLRRQFERIERELHEVGCACIGFDPGALLQRDALQRLLLERGE
jgi:hypothetical protein